MQDTSNASARTSSGTFIQRTVTKTLTAAVLLLGALTSTAQTNPSAYTTGYRYDAGSRLVGVIQPDPDGAGTLKFLAKRTTYNAQGLVSSEESGELGAWQSQSVLPANWEANTSYTVYNRKDYTYDNEGRKLTEKASDPRNLSLEPTLTQYSYDNVGRLECTAVRMNPTAFGSLPPSACVLGTQGSYGPDRITQNFYDTTTHILKIQRAVGVSGLQQDYATYTYTPNGKQKSATDANQNRTEYDYDDFDRLWHWYFPSKTQINTANTGPGGDFEQYDYDKNGNRTSLRKRDASTITYGYDALNRVTNETYSGNAAGGNVFYAYDLRSLQTSALFGSGANAGITGLTYTYDGFGQMKSASTNQSGVARTLNYDSYDSEGHRLQITHPDGVAFGYAYDGLNRLKQITEVNTSTAIASIAYDAAGRRKTLTRGASVSSTAYDYDGINRLTTLTQDLSGTNRDEVRGFGYSPASQMLSRSLSNPAYSYAGVSTASTAYLVNGLNQYTQVGANNPIHDPNGNMTWDGCTLYGYDILNRMTSANANQSASCAVKSVNIAYDPKGRLYQTSGGASGTTQYLYDGDALVAEYNGTGTLLRRYVHGSGVDEPLVVYEGSLANATTRRYQHTDHQGSITAYTDASGNALFVNTYDPYGLPGANNNTRFQYTGQIFLPDVALYYYKARFYNPSLGRFMQTDPIGYKDDLDLYSYVGNDPFNRTDPTGTVIETVGSEEFKKKVKSSIDKISEKQGGKTLINSLEQTKNTIKIIETQKTDTGNKTIPAEEYTPGGKGTGSTVKFNPEKLTGGKDETGSKQRPPFVGLAHELGHAQAIDKGEQVFDKGSGKSGTTPPQEIQSMNTENMVRKEHGLPLRPAYYE